MGNCVERMLYGKFKKWMISLYLIALLIGGGLRVEAATADELRELIGEKRLTDESRTNDIYRVLHRHRQAEMQNELVRLLDLSVAEYEEKIEDLRDNKEVAHIRFYTAFSAGEDGASVLGLLNKAYEASDRLGELPNSESYVIDLIEEDERLVAYFESLEASIGEVFDLGHIGEGTQSPLMGPLEVMTPFGRYREIHGNAKLCQSDGVVLRVPYEDSVKGVAAGSVVSQFHGKVKSVTKLGVDEDKDGKITYYRVVIEHGKSVVTTYEKLKNVIVKPGDKVAQYQVLGELHGDGLYFQIDLNGVPINPLFLYGGNGERAYETYYYANPGILLSKEDFSHVKKEVKSSGSVAMPGESSVIINEDGTETPLLIEGQEEKPDVPVADYTGKH